MIVPPYIYKIDQIKGLVNIMMKGCVIIECYKIFKFYFSIYVYQVL